MRTNVIHFPGATSVGGAGPPGTQAEPPRPAAGPDGPDGPDGPAGPAPLRLSWPLACVAGYLGGAALTVVLIAVGGTRHLAADVAAYAVLAAVIGWWSRPAGAAIAAVIGWLFFDGFLAGRHAALHWHGTADEWRLGVLAVAAVLASAARELADRRLTRPRDGLASQRPDRLA